MHASDPTIVTSGPAMTNLVGANTLFVVSTSLLLECDYPASVPTREAALDVFAKAQRRNCRNRPVRVADRSVQDRCKIHLKFRFDEGARLQGHKRESYLFEIDIRRETLISRSVAFSEDRTITIDESLYRDPALDSDPAKPQSFVAICPVT